jgi:hypothetical protein
MDLIMCLFLMILNSYHSYRIKNAYGINLSGVACPHPQKIYWITNLLSEINRMIYLFGSKD